MNKSPSIPNVTLPVSGHRRLERLAPPGADRGDERVSRGDPKDVVDALFRNPAVKGKELFDDDDPEPSAA